MSDQNALPTNQANINPPPAFSMLGPFGWPQSVSPEEANKWAGQLGLFACNKGADNRLFMVIRRQIASWLCLSNGRHYKR